MGTYLEVRITGELKLEKNDKIANRIRNWLLDIRLNDLCTEEESSEVRRFKFLEEDLSEKSTLNIFLRHMLNTFNFEYVEDIFIHNSYLSNSQTDDLLKIIEERENDILYIDICIASKNKRDEMYFLIYLLYDYMQKDFIIKIDNQEYLKTLHKKDDSKIPTEAIIEINEEDAFIRHSDILYKIGFDDLEYDDIDQAYDKFMYGNLIKKKKNKKQQQANLQYVYVDIPKKN